MKIGKLFRRELLVNPYVPQKKEWLPVAMAAVSVASSLLGGAAARSAANAAERRQRNQEAKEDAWYTRRMNEHYSDTAAGQNLIRRAERFNKQNWRKAAGEQAVSGGTAAATQMAKDAGNQMMAETVANMAAIDTQRKDSADYQHRAAEDRFAQMDMQRDMQRAQNITNAASQASNAIMSAAGALDQSSVNSAKTSINSGGNNAGNQTEVVKSDGGNGPAVQLNNMKSNLDGSSSEGINIGGTDFVGTKNYKPGRWDK